MAPTVVQYSTTQQQFQDSDDKRRLVLRLSAQEEQHLVRKASLKFLFLSFRLRGRAYEVGEGKERNGEGCG